MDKQSINLQCISGSTTYDISQHNERSISNNPSGRNTKASYKMTVNAIASANSRLNVEDDEALVFALSCFEGSRWSGQLQLRAFKHNEGSATFPLLIDPIDIHCGVADVAWLESNTLNKASHSLDNRQFVAGCDDGLIRVWKITVNDAADTNDIEVNLQVELKAHHHIISCVESLKPPSVGSVPYLLSGSEDCHIKLWNMETRELIADCNTHCGAITGLSWNPFYSTNEPNENILQFMSISRDSFLYIWEFSLCENKTYQIGKKCFATTPTAICWGEDNRCAVGTASGDVIQLNVNVQKEQSITEIKVITENKFLHKGQICKIAYGPRKLLAVASDDSTVSIICSKKIVSNDGMNIEEEQQQNDKFDTKIVQTIKKHKDYVRSVLWLNTRNNTHFDECMTASWDNTVQVIQVVNK